MAQTKVQLISYAMMLLGKKNIQSIRIYALGVVDGYRKMGIEACLYGSIIKEYRERGLKHAEAGWTLENNVMINGFIAAIGSKHYKTWRIYKRNLAA